MNVDDLYSLAEAYVRLIGDWCETSGKVSAHAEGE